MNRRTWLVASLLFGSGFCALVYQTVWLRELRLVFGASTMASAAVLAIFMGGLGFGGLILGRRADRIRRPLRFYAGLEFAIAGSAALTPLLVDLAARVYLSTGGSFALGLGTATLIRLALATLVLATTTFLMGGTLPAAARAVTGDGDPGRRGIAALYGLNTLGGVTGVMVPTFLLFEHVGVRASLWGACLVNAAVAWLAWTLSRGPQAPSESDMPRTAATAPAEARPPAAFVLAAAGVVGFAFLVMELVWYRMLTPLLGGSTYTFGLILALVLLGIGAGGILYAVAGRRRAAGLVGFASTCAAEALCFALPFAAGDRIAGWALLWQPEDAAGFTARVASWALITAVIVLPGAVAAGYQFPLLIGLLGTGRRDVGRQVGLGYAWNTVGAIAGALAGGFGLMRALTAPGTWRAVVLLLLALGLAAVAMAWRGATARRRRGLGVVTLGLAGTLALIAADGPTAAWRHAPIGAGRLRLADTSPNGVRNFMNEIRRNTIWEAEGLESSVALQATFGLSFIINGKSDGSARFDAPTQVMYGLVGAILHPQPRDALVIGLGTGSTAGWLAAIPGMDAVDVVELEPAIVEVARACRSVNRDVLDNPKVTLYLGDGREMLLTSRATYDLIASEPSNPYRAGIASLFTREFYRAVAGRLNPGGIFLQWVQAYEVDEQTIRTIMATLADVFPHVETWQTAVGDLLLVCAAAPLVDDADDLRGRLQEEPFRTALADTWRVTDLEGFLARFVADAAYVRQVAEAEDGAVNTDDLPLVEFGFARSLGRTGRPLIRELRDDAVARGLGSRTGVRGAFDGSLVLEHRLAMATLEEQAPDVSRVAAPDLRQRGLAQERYLADDLTGALTMWARQGNPHKPRGLVETVVLAETLAETGSDRAQPLIALVRAHEPLEALVVASRLAWRKGDAQCAAARLAQAFAGYRDNPWPWPLLMRRGLDLARDIARSQVATAPVLFEALREPFAVRQYDHERLATALEIAKLIGPAAVVEIFQKIEPHFIWNEGILAARADFYRQAGLPDAERARRELALFRRLAER